MVLYGHFFLGGVKLSWCCIVLSYRTWRSGRYLYNMYAQSDNQDTTIAFI